MNLPRACCGMRLMYLSAAPAVEPAASSLQRELATELTPAISLTGSTLLGIIFAAIEYSASFADFIPPMSAAERRI